MASRGIHIERLRSEGCGVGWRSHRIGRSADRHWPGESSTRYQEGEPFLVQAAFEAESEPLTPDTVIVLVANQKPAGYTDSTGAEVPTFDIIGGGDPYVLHGGELVERTWFRASQAEGYVLTTQDIDLLQIPSGGIYMAVVPNGSMVEYR